MKPAPAPALGPDPENETIDPARTGEDARRSLLERELTEARAEIERLRAVLDDRESLLRFYDDREIFRFARTVVEVKQYPWRAWKLPAALALLGMPRSVRSRVRRTAARVRAARTDPPRRRGGPALDAIADAAERAPARLRAALGLFDPSSPGEDIFLGPIIANARWPEERPLVSVIMPCFNYGRFLPEALESLDRQTLQDFEIVLVEGGSTDGTTPAQVEALEHPKLRKIFQDRPTRVGENRLRGLEAARGRHVVFLDPDDTLAPTYLEKAVLALELTGVDIVYPSVLFCGGRTGVWETANAFTLEHLAAGNTIATVAMFRRHQWERLRVGYATAPDLEPVEDWDFWIRFASRRARGWKIREPLMRYRVHGASLTQTNEPRIEAARQRVLEHHRDELRGMRLARVSRAQLRRPLVARPLVNLARVRRRTSATLHVTLANPYLVVGGSDNLLLQIFGDCAQFDATISVISTVEAPPSMGSSAPRYRALTDDVFELPAILPRSAHADAVLHLLQSRRTDLLFISGSTLATELLPRIRRELPRLRVVDHLYNTVGHLEANRRFARCIDFHVVANEEVKRALVATGEDPDRISVIHHGIDMARYDPAHEPWLAEGPVRLGLAAGDRLVLYAGRLSPEKGVLRFVEIARRLADTPGLVFAMIGDGPERSAVESAIHRAGLQGRLKLLGFVDARPYLRRADVVVVPSDVEGLPLVSLESLAMGTPIVASSVGALPDVVQEGRTGFIVAPTDVEGFTSAIRRALALDADRERLARTCRASVVDRYSIDAVRARYFDVFRAVVSRPAAADRAERR